MYCYIIMWTLLHDCMHELKPIKPIFSLILLLFGKVIKK